MNLKFNVMTSKIIILCSLDYVPNISNSKDEGPSKRNRRGFVL